MAAPQKELLKNIINIALKEDIGDGDHTSLACIPSSTIGQAKLIAKEDAIIAGVELAEMVFNQVDDSIEFSKLLSDGSAVKKGDIVFIVNGPAIGILQAERTVLNFMQRMSGISTKTHAIVAALSGTKTKVLDTRKTTPGIRLVEKWAVEIGGGTNHRTGLFDMIMIKDNHIDYAGGVANAIKKTHQYLESTGKDLKIEVEARNLSEVQEILNTGGVDRIMLDNFDYEQTKKAVALINGSCETESSGNITIDAARRYADCGVDYISVGALTHTVNSIDLSLKAVI